MNFHQKTLGGLALAGTFMIAGAAHSTFAMEALPPESPAVSNDNEATAQNPFARPGAYLISNAKAEEGDDTPPYQLLLKYGEKEGEGALLPLFPDKFPEGKIIIESAKGKESIETELGKAQYLGKPEKLPVHNGSDLYTFKAEKKTIHLLMVGMDSDKPGIFVKIVSPRELKKLLAVPEKLDNGTIAPEPPGPMPR